MCKLFVVCLTILLLTGSSPFISLGQEATDEKEQASSYALRVGEKIAHGTRDMLLGWTEIPKEVVEISRKTKNPAWGLLAGSFRGVAKAIQVTTSGISEVIFAPVTAEKKR